MRILLIDDDPLSCKAVNDFLTVQLGHDVTQCDNGSEGIKKYEEEPFPLIISDIRMPGVDGIEMLSYIKKLPQGQFTDIVLFTGYGNMESAIRALRAGAYDYLLKPIDIEQLAAVIDRVEEHISLVRENVEYKKHFDKKVNEATAEIQEQFRRIQNAYNKVVGLGQIGIFSEKMRSVQNLAQTLHQDRAVPVLIEGETGTGKEVVARMVHYGEGKTTSPFISLNCSAISPNLFETEFFGYEEGAFTDARKKGAKGKLELAQGGTVFLDEIGDLPVQFQPKLLRVLEEKEFYRVGGIKKIKLDIRVICATNQHLEDMVEKGTFRQDLYYRLNVGRIELPPLRDRKEAIGPLAQMFLQQFALKKKRRFQFIQKEALEVLEKHSWPGNVRELQNTVERVVLLYDDTEVHPEHFVGLNGTSNGPAIPREGCFIKPGHIVLPPDSLPLDQLETEIVQKALTKFNGNKTRTATYLGLTRSALRSRMKD